MKAKVAAETADAEKTERLWQSLYEKARAGRFSQLAGRRLDTLDVLAEAQRIRFDERLRTETIAALALTDARPSREWDDGPAASHIVFDEAFERYAGGDGSGRVSVRRVANDQEIVRFKTGCVPTGCTSAPTGDTSAPTTTSGRRRFGTSPGSNRSNA